MKKSNTNNNPVIIIIILLIIIFIIWYTSSNNIKTILNNNDLFENSILNNNPQSEFTNSQYDFSNPQSDFTNPQTNFTNPQTNFTNPQSDFINYQYDFSNPQSNFTNPQSNFTNPQSDFSNPQTNFTNPQSNFTNPQTNFTNPQSDFSNPQSNFTNPQYEYNNVEQDNSINSQEESVNQELLNQIRKKTTNSSTLNNIIPSISSLNAVQNNNILKLQNNDDINNLMVGGTFRLKVNLPKLPPYIKGEDFDTKNGKNSNYFYLSVAKLDPNCNIVAIDGSCLSLYIDEKKCTNKKLSISSQSSPYRLILISETYATNPDLPFINNLDFTLVNINNNLYIKNVATGYYPTLFQDNLNIDVYGNMINDNNSNINKIPSLLNNNVCKESIQPIDLDSESLMVKCSITPDNNMYLMTSSDITQSSPLNIQINNDNTINLSLKTYNTFGFSNNSYALIFGDFDIKTFKDIEKITVTDVATFFVNMVCFDSNVNGKLTNTNKLNFIVELISFPANFYNKTSILSSN